MGRITLRTDDEKKEAVRKWHERIASGANRTDAAEGMHAHYSSLIAWEKKFAGEKEHLPTVTVARKPYTKRERPDGKAVIIVTSLSNLSEALKSL